MSADQGAPPRTGIGFFSSFSTACNSPISAGAQTLIFWPGALAGHYGVEALRADLQGPRGNTF